MCERAGHVEASRGLSGLWVGAGGRAGDEGGCTWAQSASSTLFAAGKVGRG